MDGEIQGVSVHKTDKSFFQSIIDAVEIINDCDFYYATKFGDRIQIGKLNANKDIIIIKIDNLMSLSISNDEITFIGDYYSAVVNSIEPAFIIY